MKYLLRITVIIFYVSQFYGCESDSVSTNIGSIFIIEGKIVSNEILMGAEMKMEAYSTGNSNLNVYVFDQTTIGSDTSFRLNILAPPNNLLYSFNDMRYGNALCSDTSTRFYTQDVFNVYKNNLNYGIIYGSEKASDPLGNSFSKYWITIMYSTKDVSIIGKDSNSTRIYNYNMLLKSGWNIIVHNKSQLDSSTIKYDVIVDNNFKSNWIFQKY